MSRYDEDRHDDRMAAWLEREEARELAVTGHLLPVAVTPPQLPLSLYDHEFVPTRCALCGDEHAGAST